jgi:chromosome partitioning protein
MGKVIAVANQKGGVAKTTTTQAMSAILNQRGFKTLVIDFDPQGNLSDSIGAVTEEASTIYEVLKQEVPITGTIQKLSAFDIIPADIILASADQTLSQTGKEYRLKEAIEPIRQQYDYIVIDTPPSLAILTVNAFTASDEVIVPTTAGKFAVQGIKELSNTVNVVRKYCNSNLKICGILFTKFDPRTNNSKDMQIVVAKISKALDIPLFKTFIRSRVAVDEAQSRSQSLLDYKGCEEVISDYNDFVNEYLRGEL